ncbi:MAG: hypothetical protein ACE5R6_12860 [Candidatus Heimdallarchaeota archaeon]
MEPKKPFTLKIFIKPPRHKVIIIRDITVKKKSILRVIKKFNIPRGFSLQEPIEVLYLLELTRYPVQEELIIEVMIEYLEDGIQKIYSLSDSIVFYPSFNNVKIEFTHPNRCRVGETFTINVKITNQEEEALKNVQFCSKISDLVFSDDLRQVKDQKIGNIAPGESFDVKLDLKAMNPGYKRINGLNLKVKGPAWEDEEVRFVPEGIIKVF